MAKNKKKNKDKDKEIEKIILSVFVLSLAGLGAYYINQRIKIGKEIDAAIGGQNQIQPPQDQNGIQTVICKGDNKPEVRILQSYLKFVRGENIGSAGVDGKWGTDTQTAINNIFSQKPTCFNQNAIDTMRIAYQGF
jgi:hypothetical protein